MTWQTPSARHAARGRVQGRGAVSEPVDLRAGRLQLDDALVQRCVVPVEQDGDVTTRLALASRTAAES